MSAPSLSLSNFRVPFSYNLFYCFITNHQGSALINIFLYFNLLPLSLLFYYFIILISTCCACFLTQDGRVCWFDLRCPDVPQLVMDVSVEPVSSICFKSGLFYLLVFILLSHLCFQLIIFKMQLRYFPCIPVLGREGFMVRKRMG